METAEELVPRGATLALLRRAAATGPRARRLFVEDLRHVAPLC